MLDARAAASTATATSRARCRSVSAGQFASWAGASSRRCVDRARARRRSRRSRKSQTRLARVGLENVAGYLAGGLRPGRVGPAAREDRADRRGRAGGADRRGRATRGRGRAPAGRVAERDTSRRPCRCRSTSSRSAPRTRSRAARRRRCARAATARRSPRACWSGSASEDHERRRRHGGVERGEAGSQHTVVGRRFDAELGTRVVDGGRRRNLRGIAGARAGREARRERLELRGSRPGSS